MINKIIAFSIWNKLIVGLLVLALVGVGLYSMSTINLDAQPDITNNQVQVITQSPNLATEVIYRMNKNSKLVTLKTPDKARAIIERYRENRTFDNDLIFHYLKDTDLDDSQKVSIRTQGITRNLNRHLKKIASKLGITKKMSMHIARHSFGNISGDKIPIQMLQKLYRHSSVKTTIKYQSNFIYKDAGDALDSVVNF